MRTRAVDSRLRKMLLTLLIKVKVSIIKKTKTIAERLRTIYVRHMTTRHVINLF